MRTLNSNKKIEFTSQWRNTFGWSFLIGFMYILFGPIEIFFSNINDLPLVFGDFFVELLFVFLIFVLGLTTVFAVLPKRCFNITICLEIGAGLASYVQYFMNGKLGLWDGSDEVYEHPVLNLMIWALLFAAIFILKSREMRRLWDTLLLFIPWCIVAMQVVAIITLLLTSNKEAFQRNEGKYIFSGDETYTVSGESNIIVLVLDCFSNQTIDPLLDKYPDALVGMEDFTYYDNVNSIYESTYASLTNLLTGTLYDTESPYYEWADAAWSSVKTERLFSELKKNDYKVQVFTDDLLYGNHPEYVEEKVNNFSKISVLNVDINKKKTIWLFLRASAYRYVPNMLKPYFIISTDDFANTVEIEYDNATSIIKRNYEYYDGLLNGGGLTADFSSNYFILQHLRGTHPPYWIDENGLYIEEGDLMGAARGCMLIVQEYLNQLKALGVYDEATIIVMSDHGNQQTCDGVQPIFFMKLPGVKQTELTVSSAPVSYEDFIPTILDILGNKDTEVGQSILDLQEDMQRERVMYIRQWDERYPAVPRSISGGDSSINVLYKYTYIGDSETLKQIESDAPSEIIPLSEYPN